MNRKHFLVILGWLACRPILRAADKRLERSTKLPLGQAASGGAVTCATDDFNRSNAGDLGANWTTVTSETTFHVNANQADPLSTVADCGSWYSGTASPAFTDNQFSQCTMKTITGGSANDGTGVGVSVRVASGARTYYRCVVNAAGSGNVEIAKSVAGTYTFLARTTSAFVSGDVLRLEVNGTTLTAYKNGVSILTIGDSSVTTGKPGLAYSSVLTAASVDDWSGGNL